MINYSLSGEISPDDERQILWAWQREFRGFDDTELWNLDNTITRFILPRLKAFRGHRINKDIDEMIEGFELNLLDFPDKIQRDKITNGLILFRKHFFNLWY